MDSENQSRTEELSAKVNRLKHVCGNFLDVSGIFKLKFYFLFLFLKMTIEMDKEVKSQNNFLGSMVNITQLVFDYFE
jgi:hypothetical protein